MLDNPPDTEGNERSLLWMSESLLTATTKILIEIPLKR
jgi:hypothetical protein